MHPKLTHNLKLEVAAQMNLPAPIASVILVLYVSDFSSSTLAPSMSVLDVEPDVAYKQCSTVF